MSKERDAIRRAVYRAGKVVLVGGILLGFGSSSPGPNQEIQTLSSPEPVPKSVKAPATAPPFPILVYKVLTSPSDSTEVSTPTVEPNLIPGSTANPTSTEAPTPASTPEPTATSTPTPQETKIPYPTSTEVIEKGVGFEKIEIGRTALGNPIEMELIFQGKNPKNTILIVGGVHPQENTGWKLEDKSGVGWLLEIKNWFLENKEDWRNLRVAFVDINPDGRGRKNPNGVDLNRNFDCYVCEWHPTNPKERDYADPDGPSPMSEPESQALMNAVETLKRDGRVIFMVLLHNQVPPNGLVDPGSCRKNKLSCEIAKMIAELTGVKYKERWDRSDKPQYPEGLAGQPADYFSEKGVPTADFEFSQRKPNKNMAENFAKGLLKAVRAVGLN